MYSEAVSGNAAVLQSLLSEGFPTDYIEHVRDSRHFSPACSVLTRLSSRSAHVNSLSCQASFQTRLASPDHRMAFLRSTKLLEEATWSASRFS